MNALKAAFGTIVLICLGGIGLFPGEPKPKTAPVKRLILPGESFLVEGRPAFILLPPPEKRQDPQPWIMYAPTLPAYPDSHEKWMHEQFLQAGVAVAGIDAGEAYGSPKGQKLMTALYEELVTKRGFASKPCLLGRSRGGLWVSSWAIRHPDKVSGIAGIYPVFDLRTYPGLDRAAPAYDIKPEELDAALDEHNPIARMDVLAKAKVPVFIIHGDEDKVVPLKENSQALAESYKAAKSDDVVELIVAEGQGHNFWPGFFGCQKLVDFAVRQAKVGAELEKTNRKPKPATSSDDSRSVVKDLEYAKAGGKSLKLDLVILRHLGLGRISRKLLWPPHFSPVLGCRCACLAAGHSVGFSWSYPSAGLRSLPSLAYDILTNFYLIVPILNPPAPLSCP